MARTTSPSTDADRNTFDAACSELATALAGSFRREIVADAARAATFRESLTRLRACLRSNNFQAGTRAVRLGEIVGAFDQQTRRDGFHAIHDWDGKAARVNEHTIAVDVLNYLIDKRGSEQPDVRTLAILLDYHFLYVLALLSLRVWDQGNADRNLDRLDRLLADLHGEHGSGHAFVANAETLMVLATSHYEPAEHGYREMLERIQTLDRRHRTASALVHAGSLGAHLRFGFEATYGRDTVSMRDDNVADYPWVCFALTTLMNEYARMRDENVAGVELERIVEAILNALTPDARAFVGQAPSSLAPYAVERAEFTDLFNRYRSDLLEAFEQHRPSDRAYSPLSFFFNFSYNIVKGAVVDALLRSEAWPISFNDLLTAVPRNGPKDEGKTKLAQTLMAYARANPDTIRKRLMAVIVYDPQSGREAFSVAIRKIKG